MGGNVAWRLPPSIARQVEVRGSRLAGIATFVKRDKGYLATIVLYRNILRAQALRFFDEVRTPDDIGLAGYRETEQGHHPPLLQGDRRTVGVDRRGARPGDPYAHKVEKLVKQKLKKNSDVVHVESDTVQEEGARKENRADRI